MVGNSTCHFQCLTVSIHAPAKGATWALSRVGISSRVSIHAPAKGATITVLTACGPYGVSIHAPAKGATWEAGSIEVWGMFQSTRPRRARPGAEGEERRCRRVSIHAPAKGATRAVLDRVQTNIGFNPRAREGRDASSGDLILSQGWFQSTRPRRARRPGLIPTRKRNRFQSTRPRRARRRSAESALALPCSFNPRAREGRDPRHRGHRVGV